MHKTKAENIIMYSPDNLLSNKSEIIKLNATEVETRFNFKLLYGDLSNSFKSSASFIKKIGYNPPLMKSHILNEDKKSLVVHAISEEIGNAV